MILKLFDAKVSIEELEKAAGRRGCNIEVKHFLYTIAMDARASIPNDKGIATIPITVIT